MKLSEVKAGDDVMHVGSYRGARRVKVSKVGRKWLYLEERGTSSRDGYDRENGQAADGFGSVETLEAYKRRCDEENARKELRELGIVLSWAPATTCKALEILAAVKPILATELPSEGAPK